MSEHDLIRGLACLGVRGNELLEEHAGEPCRIRAAGPVLHAAECGRGAEQLVATECGLQQQVVTQSIMIV